MYVYIHESNAQRGQKKAQDLQIRNPMQLQDATGMLGSEFRSSTRAITALNHKAISAV